MSWVWAAIIGFFSALSALIFGKIVTDSLPDMSIRSLIKHTKKTLVYSRFFLVFGVLILLKRIGKITPEMERQLSFIFVVISIIVVAAGLQKQVRKIRTTTS